MANVAIPSEDLSVECSETSSVVRSIRVEVAAQRVSQAFDRAYKELGRNARIKGFRPGKAPRSVLVKMYGASMPDQIEHTLVSETIAQAIERAEVEPVVEPDIDAERPSEGKPFRYTARVEVKPAIELPDLGGLAARRTKVIVGEEEIDAQLERMREQNAPLVEEPEGTLADTGHTVTMDYAGKVDGEAFPGGTGEGMEVEIGTGRMVPGFEEQLVGVKTGDDCEITVTFPEDYGPEHLNGKQAVFACHITAVRKKQLPELDDEFAKDLGEDIETLADLKEKIRADFAKRREAEAERGLQESLMDALIERVEFEVPPGIVERQLQSQLQQIYQQLHGRVPDDLLRNQLTRMQEEGRPSAERRVREALLLDAIAQAESIEAGPLEVEERLAEMAGAQGMDVEQLRAMAEAQGWLPGLEQEVRDKKIYAWLAERAEIEETEPADEAAHEHTHAD